MQNNNNKNVLKFTVRHRKRRRKRKTSKAIFEWHDLFTREQVTAVSFQGPTYYDSLENDIKESNSLHLFKTKLKKIYIYELLVTNLVVRSYISSHV